MKKKEAKILWLTGLSGAGKTTLANQTYKKLNKYNFKLLKIDGDIFRKKTKNKNNLVGVNTHLANKIVHHALTHNLIDELNKCDHIKTEVFFNKETRFDFLVNKKNQKIFLEVKNVTLFRSDKIAEFPDAITSRGSKHLKTLIDAIKKGYKSYIVFLVQIQGMKYFKIANDIDNEYYQNYLNAKKAGVNFLAYRCKISPKEIRIEKKLKIID